MSGLILRELCHAWVSGGTYRPFVHRDNIKLYEDTTVLNSYHGGAYQQTTSGLALTNQVRLAFLYARSTITDSDLLAMLYPKRRWWMLRCLWVRVQTRDRRIHHLGE